MLRELSSRALLYERFGEMRSTKGIDHVMLVKPKPHREGT